VNNLLALRMTGKWLLHIVFCLTQWRRMFWGFLHAWRSVVSAVRSAR